MIQLEANQTERVRTKNVLISIGLSSTVFSGSGSLSGERERKQKGKPINQIILNSIWKSDFEINKNLRLTFWRDENVCKIRVRIKGGIELHSGALRSVLVGYGIQRHLLVVQYFVTD